MKKKHFPAFAVLIFVLFICLLSTNCGKKQKTKPQWTVEEADGITIIKNSPEPLYGEFIFELEEDFNFGGDPEKENYYFPRGVRNLKVDNQFNLYLVDIKNRRVQKYDRNGDYLATIGRQGQGPGEYGFPSEVCLSYQDKIWIYDPPARAFKIFTSDGSYEKKVAVKALLQRAFILGKGYIIGFQEFLRAPEGPRMEIVKINQNTAELETIATYVTKKKESHRWVGIHYYSPRINLYRIDRENFCYGFPSEYKIHIADGAGKTVQIIEKQEDSVPISHAEKKKTAEEGVYMWTGSERPDKISDLDFPPHRPFFSRLIADDQGRIYTMKHPSILEEDVIREFDVFGADGVFLYHLSLSFFPQVILSGFIYEIRQEEDTGEVSIVRHKINNWGEFKSHCEK